MLPLLAGYCLLENALDLAKGGKKGVSNLEVVQVQLGEEAYFFRRVFYWNSYFLGGCQGRPHIWILEIFVDGVGSKVISTDMLITVHTGLVIGSIWCLHVARARIFGSQFSAVPCKITLERMLESD